MTRAWKKTVEAPPAICHFRRADGSRVERSVTAHLLRIASDDGPPFERVAGPVLRLRVRTFWPTHAAYLAAFVDSVDEVRRAPAIVVDLRGNGGGSDGFASDWFAALHPQVRSFAIDILESDAVFAGRANMVRADLAGVEGADARAAGELLLARTEKELAAIGSRRVRRRQAATPLGKSGPPYRGTLVLLVDRNCGSSCETMVHYARQVPGTIVVGENTAGSTRFGQVGLFRLPASGLRVHLGSWAFPGPDEGRGYLPDVWIDGDDPVGVARWVAQCARDTKCRAALAPGADPRPSRR